MAFPQVAATAPSSTETASTSHVVAMPTGSGGRLVMLISAVGRPTLSGTDLSAWTQISTRASDNTGDQSLFAYYRDSDPAGSTITVTSSTNIRTAHHVWRITGFDSSTPPAGVHTGTGTNSLNPPANNPAAWDIEDTLWLASASSCNDGFLSNFSGFPASYTGTGQRVTAGTAADGVGLGWAHRENAVASEDPAIFTGTFGRGSAFTIAIRPSAGAAVALDGTTSTVVGANGDLSVSKLVEGDTGVVVDATGALSATKPLSSTSAGAVVELAGELTVTPPAGGVDLDGTMVVVIDVGGDLSVARGLDGTIEVVVATGGDLDVGAPVALDGEILLMFDVEDSNFRWRPEYSQGVVRAWSKYPNRTPGWS